MTSRLARRFAELRAQKRAALIPFIMGFDPDRNASQTLLQMLPAAGADLIEVGMPFSDPMADGPIIEAAGRRALQAGATITGILDMVHEFRRSDTDTPIILMGYYNPVYRYGGERFAENAARAGVDGVILVDLPPEEEAEFRTPAHAAGLAIIRLIAPTSDTTRLPVLLKNAEGFVYYIAVKGITGAKSADMNDLQEELQRLRQHTSLPIAVGFGVKTPAQAAQIAQCADAVVIGSALVERMKKDSREKTLAFITELAGAIRP